MQNDAAYWVAFEKLALRHSAWESTDGSDFRRQARLLQALWRVERDARGDGGFSCGSEARKAREIKAPDGSIKTLPARVYARGSRLPMPWAEEHLNNYLTETIRAAVRREIAPAAKIKNRLLSPPRIFDDLLSSQPLCFNLFAELEHDLETLSAVVSQLTDRRFRRVTKILFEYSPERKSPRYTEDGSAFDVYLACETRTDGLGFIGMEVKYHEDMKVKKDTHKTVYDRVAKDMRCFASDLIKGGCLHAPPLQQLWRDHLLMGSIRMADGFADAMFVVLYPAQNLHVKEAVTAYRGCLTDTSSFDAWTLEDFVRRLRMQAPQADWLGELWDRYLDFGKIGRELNVPGSTDSVTQPRM